MNPRRIFWLILLLTFLAIFVDLPNQIPLKFKLPLTKIGWKDITVDQVINRPQLDLKLGNFHFTRDLEIKQGIDLAGGTHLVFQADMTGIEAKDRESALEGAKESIDRRVNLFGVAEPLIQTSQAGDDYRLVVELPGIQAIDEAIDLIGQTAQLEFWEMKPEATEAASINDFQATDLTGADLVRSQVQFDPDTGQPVVGLEFNDEGTKKFAEITKRNLDKPVAIFLDQFLLMAPPPIVENEITTGQAIIRGDFPLDYAKKMSIQLNAGALPVPIKIVEQRNIGATLGSESVQKSLQAGLIGLLMVIFFMAAYYGYLGFLADVGLIIYALLTLTLYKLIPVTLTLPGVAGFILSVGMAVDSNILIFERMKEEIRAGKPRQLAMELGFGRAWDSIRDANVCTLITCFILFNPFNWSFLNASGMIRGFALTLGIGVGLSLFTGIVVTRTILRVFSRKEKRK